MAAYAALVSVMHIIDQIEHHPRPPVSLDKNQVESLTEKVTFLQEFLEGYNSHAGYSSEADALEMRIADAAYAAEDVIESHIMDRIHGGEQFSSVDLYQGQRFSFVDLYKYLRRVTEHMDSLSKEGMDRIHGGSTSHEERFSSVDLYQGLQKVMADMDSLIGEAMEIKERMVVLPHQLHRSSSIFGGSLRSSSTGKNMTMVGFEDVLLELMDKLTRGWLDRRIIPIVGMGGTGKTTLARNLYAKPLIIEHFDLCAWATISQEYDTRDILRGILSQFNREGRGDSTENELGEMLHKHLWGRRYLIVMDDMWSTGAWDDVQCFFPDNKNGSRIMMTTRLSNLAFQLTGSCGFQMKFLDEDKSWNLFCKIVFGKEDCPIELEEIGKKIVKNCKGLPLSIVVIGGLLTKYEGTPEFWEYTLENTTSSAINLEDDERCLKILYTSFKELPVHLKPCFLYMGIFQEDKKIRVSELIKLWVAEGFLKPIDGKSLEVVAEEYLMELIDRNLILVDELGSYGKMKLCKIHDLLRDLCLREAQKQKFLCVIKLRNLNSTPGVNTERRIVIHGMKRNDRDSPQVLNALKSARSLITTRISNLAFQLTGSYGFQMKFLDEDESWNLFSEIVFGKEDCPVELEEIGKKIVKNCKGLPLSIVVTGGLLTKYEGTREYWEYIVENTSSAINSEDGERCLQILYASYKELPIHLKPCFLYMGLFQEDSEIRVSRLIKLWVAEGFLKPAVGKSLEVVTEEYLAELVDRNLVLVHKLGSTGRIKYCNIHDLLRDLCLREAEKQRFYYVAKQHSLLNLQGINTQRRISILDNASQKKVLDALQSTSLARSLIWDERDPPPINCRLLRILNKSKEHSYGGRCFLENILRLVNSRHLAVRVNSGSRFVFPICLPWNLHTLIIDGYSGSAPVEIWKMPQLRHIVVFELSLPFPFSRRDNIVLENLQTLGRILNFKCGEEVVKRIPNIKKLDVEYTRSERAHHHRLVNLERLHKLTSFRCCGFVEDLTFPRSLMKLTLVENVPEYWEDVLGKVGSLPFLEKLKLMFVIFNEGKWETVEGQFPSLRFLLIQVCNLGNWTTDSTHFPRLEHLVIKGVFTGLEIPSSIGEIPTLETIELEYCNKSMLLSAKKILDEQEKLGNESLHVRARITNAEENEGLESLASLNLHVSRF